MTVNKGFTLIEVIIYIAILAFLVGSGVAAAFYIIDSQEKNKSDVNIESEAHFLIRRIEWVMTGSAITSPASGTSGASLTVSKSGSTITIDSSSGRARIDTGAGAVPITNDRVTIQSLTFDHIAAAGSKPEAIHASFVINGTTYETTKYLRK